MTPSRARDDYWLDGTTAWITSGKVGERRIESADQYVTAAAVRECNLKVFPAGTILIGLIGQGKTRATVARLACDAAINQNVAAIEPNSGVSAGFLAAYLTGQYERLRGGSQGTGPDALSCSSLASFQVVLPNAEVQHQIAAIGDAFDDRIATETAYLTALRALKRALADALLSGRVRIPPHLWPADGTADAA